MTKWVVEWWWRIRHFHPSLDCHLDYAEDDILSRELGGHTSLIARDHELESRQDENDHSRDDALGNLRECPI